MTDAKYDQLIADQKELIESLKEMTFVVETVAHLQGHEATLLPLADRARELIDRLEKCA